MLPFLSIPGLLLSLAVLTGSLSANQEPTWLRYPAVSPDGTQIAFTSGGQIWRVPSTGGEAVPLTSGLFYAKYPVWSPDGSQLAFASTRYGNPDVFIMPATGGEVRRLTYHSSGDVPTAFSPDGKILYFESTRLGDAKENFGGYFAQVCTQLFSVPTTGGREKLIVSIPCNGAVPSPDGRFFLYTDKPSRENPWRKHEVSAASRDVWVYDTDDASHRQITFEPENDQNPVWSDEAGALYYLSEKSGSLNVWSRSLKGKDAPQQITRHKTHPVRFLSISKGGDLVYGYDGRIWRMPKGAGEAEVVEVSISQGSLLDGPFHANVTNDISEISVSSDGKQLAVIARGEVFVIDPASGKSRRITTTPEHESNVSFSPDGTRLLYISHRDGNWDAYETTIGTPEVTSFLVPGPLVETPLIATDTDVLSPIYSPDGKFVAFEEDYSRIRVFNRETKTTATAVKDGHLFSYKVNDLPFTWSPDGKRLAVTTGSAGGQLEIQLADPTGQSEPINVTQSGYAEIGPVFSPNGKAVYYLSSREGLKSADAKDAQYDVYVTYLTQEAYDNRDKPMVLPSKPAGKAEEKGAKEEKAAQAPEWSPEPEGMARRTVRISPFSGPGLPFAVLPDGLSALWLTSSPTAGYTAFKAGPGGAGLTPAFSYAKRLDDIVVDAQGANCYLTHSGGIDCINLATGAARPVPVKLAIDYDLRGEMAYLFEYLWRTTKIKFYRKDMQGVDWDLYREEYAKYLPSISRWEDMAEMLSEMAGELNASHMGSAYVNPPSYGEATGSLGLYYDHSFEGPGMRITDYLQTGPAGKVNSQLRPGATILAVDGVPVTKDMDIYPLLNHKAGVPVQLTLKTAAGKDARETVTPVSFAEALHVLAYDRWVERCRETTERLSKGRLGYLHVPEMMTNRYKEFYGQLFSDEFTGKEGVVVDVRFNGGGNLSEQLLADLSAKYAGKQVDRNDNYLGDMPRSRWWKPSILLANTYCYSDSSIFPHIYKSAGVGKFVGTPVPGTGTSVWQIWSINNKLLYTLPELGRKYPDGRYFENTQDEPDILVRNTPDSIEDGKDLQLEAAVKALLEDLDKK